MKHYLPIPILVFALVTSGCNLLIKLPVGGPELIPTETFTVNEAVPVGATATDLILTLAPSDGSLLLSGNADGLVEGEIQYNVAEWKPVVAMDGDTLHIEQKLPDNNVSSTPRDAINEWKLELGGTLTDIAIACPTGNYTLTFADSLPDGIAIKVNAGVGNLALEFPTGVTANVEIHRGPASIATEGAWTKDGKVYTSGDSGPVWTITVDFGVGNLTLVSQ